MKVHQIPDAIFETTGLGFIQILHHCSAQTLYTLDKKNPSKGNFQTFEWLGQNSPHSSCDI